ncbi:MAG: hypothetical protein H0U53_09215 [Actinobacteria bacterium]|nr:hypothetical protein [Actinomycetota bacterium]
MNKKLVSAALAGGLMLSAFSGVACDNEDEKDVEEVGENLDEGVDDLDDDGKDD